MKKMDGSSSQDGGTPSDWRLKILAALFVVIPTHFLYVEMCDLIQICLRCIPQGCQLKKRLKAIKLIV